MAELDLAALKAALVAEGVKLKEELLDKIFRKLTNPSGCENCGMHVKVGVASGNDLVTACCSTKLAVINPEPDPEPEAPADPPKEN
jgi:hypothetical protein